MNRKELVKEWFFIADKDLESAIFLKNMKPVPLEIICYHCQQCAEKYIKGFLAFKEEKIEKSHNLVLLNKKCREYNIDFKEIEEECLRLTDYGINVRYPFHIDLTEFDMKLAIKDASKVKKFVLTKAEIV